LELEKKMERLTEDWHLQPEFQQLLEIRERRNSGERQQYYEGNEELIRNLKKTYRGSVGE
jgi:23S rRNA A2030 N6-methylase RlmJ